jgi:hypothetical protein
VPQGGRQYPYPDSYPVSRLPGRAHASLTKADSDSDQWVVNKELSLHTGAGRGGVRGAALLAARGAGVLRGAGLRCR